MSGIETKKLEVESIQDLKNIIKSKQTKAQGAVNEYQSLIKETFGAYPKTELELVEFIEKVMLYQHKTDWSQK
jgi:hypothetical protein